MCDAERMYGRETPPASVRITSCSLVLLVVFAGSAQAERTDAKPSYHQEDMAARYLKRTRFDRASLPKILEDLQRLTGANICYAGSLGEQLFTSVEPLSV